jgi:RNA recognition motif-containing protein
MKLYVGNLAYSVRDEDLNNLFSTFGAVTSASVIMDKMTNRSKGFGFVEMANSEEANKAIAELNNKDFQGRNILVDVAKPPRERTDDRRGGGGGGRSWGNDR